MSPALAPPGVKGGARTLSSRDHSPSPSTPLTPAHLRHGPRLTHQADKTLCCCVMGTGGGDSGEKARAAGPHGRGPLTIQTQAEPMNCPHTALQALGTP